MIKTSLVSESVIRVLTTLAGASDPEVRWALTAFLNHLLEGYRFQVADLEELDELSRKANVFPYFIVQGNEMSADNHTLRQVRRVIVSVHIMNTQYSQPGLIQLMFALEIIENASRLLKLAQHTATRGSEMLAEAEAALRK